MAIEVLRTSFIKRYYQLLLNQKEVVYNSKIIAKTGEVNGHKHLLFLSRIPEKYQLLKEVRQKAEEFASSFNPLELAKASLKIIQSDNDNIPSIVDLSVNPDKLPKIYGIKTYHTCLVVDKTGPHFVKGVFPREKTPEVLDPYRNFAPLQTQFDMYDDVFGRYRVIVSLDRAKRPIRPKNVGTLSYEFASRVYWDNQHDAGFGIRLMVARLTTSPDLLAEILNNRNEAKAIKFEAAANPYSPISERQKGCPFCNLSEWGGPNELYDDLVVGYASNPYRFEVDHDVHITVEKFHHIRELRPEHFIDFIRLACRRAKVLAKNRAEFIDNVILGMNYGTGIVENGTETNSSFASFQHLHLQLTSSPKGVYNPGDEVADFIENWPYQTSFFDAYLSALKKDGLLIRSYGGRAYLVAPRAGMGRHHLQILTRPQVGNLVEMDEMDQLAVGEALDDAIFILQRLGLPSFNIISCSKRFSDKRIGQPLIIDVIPRGGIAYKEISGEIVLDTPPEVTAAESKKILKGSCESDKCIMRHALANGTLDEIKRYRPDQIHNDPIAAHLLYGNPHQEVRYWAASEVGLNVVLYGKDIGRFETLPPDLIVQFGRNSWDSFKRGDSMEEIKAALNKIANKKFALLSLEVLRAIIDEKLIDKFKDNDNRLILDQVIDRLVRAHGEAGIAQWPVLCNLSREEIKRLLVALN